jgi:hypothetical protein
MQQALHGGEEGANLTPWQRKQQQRQALTQGGHKTWYGGGGKPIVLTPKAFDISFGNRPTLDKVGIVTLPKPKGIRKK